MLIAPYTFAEWEDAMFAILRTPGFRDDLRLFVDPRGVARPTNDFVESLVDFFFIHEARLGGARAAVLVSNEVGLAPIPEPLIDLQVGRLRIRTFHQVGQARSGYGRTWGESPAFDLAPLEGEGNAGRRGECRPHAVVASAQTRISAELCASDRVGVGRFASMRNVLNSSN
jgi:hypothetical protein